MLLPVYLELVGLPRLVASPAVAAAYCFGIALLMVSKVPAWSGKRLGSRIPREQVMPLFVCVVLFVAVLVTWPWVMLSVLCIAYLAMLPFSALRYARLSRDYRQRLALPVLRISTRAASASDGENRPVI